MDLVTWLIGLAVIEFFVIIAFVIFFDTNTRRTANAIQQVRNAQKNIPLECYLVLKRFNDCDVCTFEELRGMVLDSKTLGRMVAEEYLAADFSDNRTVFRRTEKGTLTLSYVRFEEAF